MEDDASFNALHSVLEDHEALTINDSLAGDADSSYWHTCCGGRARLHKIVIFQFIAISVLIAVFVWNMLVPNVRPAWWILTQITAWVILTMIVYLVVSALIDSTIVLTPRWQVHRDRWFTTCLALSLGVALGWLGVVLPFSPRLLNIGSCANSKDCVAASEFVAILLANILPAVIMSVDTFTIKHKFAYRNVWVELIVLVIYVALFLGWSLICSAINKDWPYDVQSLIGDHLGVSIAAHILMVIIFVLFYFVGRFVTNRFWAERQARAHFTDKLLSSIQRAWTQVPTANEFEINTFPDDRDGGGAGAVLTMDAQLSETVDHPHDNNDPNALYPSYAYDSYEDVNPHHTML